MVDLITFDWDDEELIPMYMDKEEKKKVMKAQGKEIIYIDTSDEENNASSNDKAEVKEENSVKMECTGDSDKKDKENTSDKESGTKPVWKISDFCQALYSEDNLYYEAIIISIPDANTYKVRFHGYGNEELVSCDNMRETHGTAAQEAQDQYASFLWSPGDYCCAIYDADGKWYEAEVISIDDDDTCTVKFIGYEGAEIVHSLQPSRGEIARSLQKKIADARKKTKYSRFSSDDEYSSHCSRTCSEHNSTSVAKKPHFEKRSKSHHNISSSEKNGRRHHSNSRPLDTVMINPAPPTTLPKYSTNDKPLAILLTTWYMAGYRTGVWQGRRSRSECACRCSCND